MTPVRRTLSMPSKATTPLRSSSLEKIRHRVAEERSRNGDFLRTFGEVCKNPSRS
jgi:hypothetical protein